jgi:hypothetical protein
MSSLPLLPAGFFILHAFRLLLTSMLLVALFPGIPNDADILTVTDNPFKLKSLLKQASLQGLPW